MLSSQHRKNASLIAKDRKKRSALSDLLDKLDFKIVAPGIDWVKTFGSKKAGGGMGLRIKNQMELDMSEYISYDRTRYQSFCCWWLILQIQNDA